MTASQNGWSVIAPNETYKWVIPGTDRHLILRKGAAGFVLAHLALWYHESVEPLNTGVWDDWGYAVRPVRGFTVISNHASGTAMDLNAVKHGMGVKNTFTLKQKVKVRARLVWMRGVVRWGEDYHTRVDGMHFEINRGYSPTHALAKRLAKTPRGKRVLAANKGAL